MKVLVVDDIATNRKILRLKLEARGITIGEAADGAAALVILEREEFDVVITDILMPGMDGYRMCREIRRNPRLRDLPVIAYTGTYIAPGDEQLALRIGADRYLRKPASTELLLRTLVDILQPGGAPRPRSPSSDDSLNMDEYNAVLVRKLDERSAKLTEGNVALSDANREIAESSARFESIVDSAMDAIITINDLHRIVLFNSAAEDMFGVRSETMLGKALELLLPARCRSSSGSQITAYVAAGGNSQVGALGAISWQRATGEEFPTEASISKVEIAGRQHFTVILRDISERKQAEAQLKLANEQLRALAARNEIIREHERTTVAREIHDVLAQDLTCLKIDLIWAAKKVARPIDEPMREAIAVRIGDALSQTDAAITTVQRIATDLRPVILDSLGISAAVEWQVEDFARRSGMGFRVRAPQADSRLSRECATAVFRILQESLTNVARHARATEVDVQFEESRDLLTLVVTDNGLGITSAQVGAAGSIGLVGMRERAQAFGGTVEIKGTPASGTSVRVNIPLDRKLGP